MTPVNSDIIGNRTASVFARLLQLASLARLSRRMMARRQRLSRLAGKMTFNRHACGVFYGLLLAVLSLLSTATSQTNNPPPTPSPTDQVSAQNSPEISSHDETPTFTKKVNLVEVRVVVRDGKGNAIGNLKQEDFQLLDNGKPQTISKFSVEKAGATPIVHQANESATPPTTETQPANVAIVPSRYVAYLFDDIHLEFGDLAQARNAAVRQLQELSPQDRAAIFTTSGQNQLDFTDNREHLTAALNRLIPKPIANTGTSACPNISYYMADLIINRNDPQALQVALQDYLNCSGFLSTKSSSAISSATVEVQSAARSRLLQGDQETRVTLDSLRNIVRRMAALPGRRIVVLVSPGFMNTQDLLAQSDIADRAVQSGIVINTLDARGLFTGMPDASEQRSSGLANGKALQYKTAELSADSDILAELAYSTGGTFFQNNNDLGAGFQRLAGPPEYSYLLAFSPQNLKLDGKYHKLKVTLKPPAEGSVQARKGYYAPTAAADASQQAKQAIDDAVLSRDEIREIPVQVQTQFFKPDENSARLSVVVHMDIRHLHYRKADGRNNDELTVVSAVFDRNGNFVTGSEKVLQLHLKDETLQTRVGSGISLKNSFDVQPGSYLVRLVVRDQEGQMAAQNTAIDIPQ
jgi:VWFA-related protein